MVVSAQNHEGWWRRKTQVHVDLAGSREVEEEQIRLHLLQSLRDVGTGAGPFHSTSYKAPTKFVTKRVPDSDVIVYHKGKHSWFHPCPTHTHGGLVFLGFRHRRRFSGCRRQQRSHMRTGSGLWTAAVPGLLARIPFLPAVRSRA